MGNTQYKEDKGLLNLLVKSCEKRKEDEALDLLSRITQIKVLDKDVLRKNKNIFIQDKIILLAVRKNMPRLVKRLIEYGVNTTCHITVYDKYGNQHEDKQYDLLYYLCRQKMTKITLGLLHNGLFDKIKEKRKLNTIFVMCNNKQQKYLRFIFKMSKVPNYMVPDVINAMYQNDLDDLVIEIFDREYLNTLPTSDVLKLLNVLAKYNVSDLLDVIFEIDNIDKMIKKIKEDDIDTFYYVNERYKKKSPGYCQL
jgi:hypothetical protein